MNAAAVKLSIERQIGVEQGIAYALANVDAIETPDDMTVVLTLTAPSDGALSAFAGMYAPYIISPKAIREKRTGRQIGRRAGCATTWSVPVPTSSTV